MTVRRETGPAGTAMSDLAKRVLAACVMVPIAVAAVWAGPAPFALLCLVGALIVLAEWHGLTRASNAMPLVVAGGGVLLLAAVSALQGQFHWAVVAIALGALVMPLVPPRGERYLWRVLGVIYAGVPLLALIGLRQHTELGAAAVLWLLLVVWATDICAYFAGRTIGGPKIYPSVSPKKTWAGLAGGMLGAAAVGWLAAVWLGQGSALALALFSALVAIVAQVGDFAESALKRRFGAKDASHLIPGHGGLMDRVDGLISASVFALAVGVLRAGAGAAAPGLLIW